MRSLYGGLLLYYAYTGPLWASIHTNTLTMCGIMSVVLMCLLLCISLFVPVSIRFCYCNFWCEAEIMCACAGVCFQTAFGQQMLCRERWIGTQCFYAVLLTWTRTKWQLSWYRSSCTVRYSAFSLDFGLTLWRNILNLIKWTPLNAPVLESTFDIRNYLGWI